MMGEVYDKEVAAREQLKVSSFEVKWVGEKFLGF